MNRNAPRDLAGFLAIARERSFRLAAARLGVKPSALSHSLRSLENRLNVRLVNRTTRSVSLTQIGQQLFDRIAPAFQNIDDALADLEMLGDIPSGTLRICAAQSTARLALMPLLAGFLKKYPEVSVEIMAQSEMVDMVREGHDVGVRFGERIAKDMIAIPIGSRRRFAVVGSPAYFKRWPTPHHPRDLLNLPCIQHRLIQGEEYIWEFEKDGVELEIAVKGRFVTNELDLMIQAALDGIGLAFVFEEPIAEYVAAGRLVRVLEDWLPPWPGLYLYYSSRRQMPSPLRAFISYVREAG